MTAVLVISVCTFLPDSCPAAGDMTLAQCIEQGIKNNPRLLAARYDVEAAGHGIKSARADFLPSLTSGYSVSELASISAKGPTETDYLDQNIRQFNIKLTQILYSGERIINTYQKAKIRKQVLEAETNMVMLEQVYKIETTFYRLMKAKQDVIAAAESVDTLAESVRSAQAFFDKELVPYVNVLQARVDLADAKEQLGIARNNVNRGRVALFELMNLTADPDIVFSGELAPVVISIPEFDPTLETALQTRPDIESLYLQKTMSGKDADIAMGKYLPTVRLDAGYNDSNRDYDALGTTGISEFDRDQRNRYWSAGIYVSWELFDGGRAWYEKERYKTQEQKFHALINEAESTISSGIRKALLAMTEADQRMKGALSALEAAKEYYALEERRLNAGISTIPDYLDAQERLVRSKGNYAQAVLDFRLAESELKLMIGTPHPVDLS